MFRFSCHFPLEESYIESNDVKVISSTDNLGQVGFIAYDRHMKSIECITLAAKFSRYSFVNKNLW